MEGNLREKISSCEEEIHRSLRRPFLMQFKGLVIYLINIEKANIKNYIITFFPNTPKTVTKNGKASGLEHKVVQE